MEKSMSMQFFSANTMLVPFCMADMVFIGPRTIIAMQKNMSQPFTPLSRSNSGSAMGTTSPEYVESEVVGSG
jgi:hypothetical protein